MQEETKFIIGVVLCVIFVLSIIYCSIGLMNELPVKCINNTGYC